MKILVAIDGSKFGEAAVKELIQRAWPANTEVCVLSVAYASPLMFDPLLIVAACHYDSLKEEQERAARDVAAAAAEIAQNAPDLHVSTKVLEGSPKEKIVEEAKSWGSDLIMMGTHGTGPGSPFLLGSVAQSVVLHAPCSVEVVRAPHAVHSAKAA